MAGSKKKPDNEQIFLKAATTEQAFRNALRSNDRDQLSKDLDRLGIKVHDKQAVLDAIAKVDWSDLKALEDRLSHATVHPLN
jgi:hypothetical protein